MNGLRCCAGRLKPHPSRLQPNHVKPSQDHWTQESHVDTGSKQCVYALAYSVLTCAELQIMCNTIMQQSVRHVAVCYAPLGTGRHGPMWMQDLPCLDSVILDVMVQRTYFFYPRPETHSVKILPLAIGYDVFVITNFSCSTTFIYDCDAICRSQHMKQASV
jgi:hypothetical protein